MRRTIAIMVVVLLSSSLAQAQVPSVLDRFRGRVDAKAALRAALVETNASLREGASEALRCGVAATPRACEEQRSKGCKCIVASPAALGTRELTVLAASRGLHALGEACAGGGCRGASGVIVTRGEATAEEIRAATRASLQKIEREMVADEVGKVTAALRKGLSLPKPTLSPPSSPLYPRRLLEIPRGTPGRETVVDALRNAKADGEWIRMLTSTPQGGIPTASAAVRLDCPSCGATVLTTGSEAAGRVYQTTSVLMPGATRSSGTLIIKRIGESDNLLLGRARDHAAVLGRHAADRVLSGGSR